MDDHGRSPDDPTGADSSSHRFSRSTDHVSLTGKLLVSPPWMDDPHFAHSVVLLLAHTPEGAFGLVLNDESTTGVDTIADVIGQAWSAVLSPPESIFVGGPCQTSSVIALGTITPQDGAEDLQAGDDPPSIGCGVSVVNLTQDGPDATIGRIRLFAGYAGWAPRQLEAELERGGWFVADALPGDALTADPERLWAAVLQRNGDPYARIPSDPRLN